LNHPKTIHNAAPQATASEPEASSTGRDRINGAELRMKARTGVATGDVYRVPLNFS
jgi:hypothetical protein